MKHVMCTTYLAFVLILLASKKKKKKKNSCLKSYASASELCQRHYGPNSQRWFISRGGGGGGGALKFCLDVGVPLLVSK